MSEPWLEQHYDLNDFHDARFYLLDQPACPDLPFSVSSLEVAINLLQMNHRVLNLTVRFRILIC